MCRHALLLLLVCLTVTARAAVPGEDFDRCLEGLQQRARTAGVAEWIVDEVVVSLQHQARVIELDRQQPEFVKTFGQYLSARVTDSRVERGRELYARHREFLDELGRRYGVPGRYLVAFWGLETNFGSYMGSMPTLDSLATLACDRRRSDFFSREFLTALKLIERENLSPQTMRGSWAGAMGHTQFMPTTYARFAVDGDGDDRVDLWGSLEDALASGAHYLNQLGWQAGARWGREILLPEDFDFTNTGLGRRMPVSSWAALGVKTADGRPLPRASLEGSVLVPAGAAGPAFLVYENFRIIMGWNRSEFYAISVGHLADRIAGAGRLRRPPPDQAALSFEDVKALQRALYEKGYDVGAADGIFGAATRQALGTFQRDSGLTPDGFPDTETLRALMAQEPE